MVDVLAQVVGTLRITTTLFAMADLPDPWGVEFPARRGAYFHTLDGGTGWLHVDGSAATRVDSGDTVLLAHGTAHRLTGSRDAQVWAVFDPVTWTPNATQTAGPATGVTAGLVDDARPVDDPGPVGPTGPTLVCGAVDAQEPGTHPLLALLPVVLRVGRDDRRASDLELTLRLLHRETHAPGPGTGTLLARLGDVLLIQLLRIWIDRTDPADRGRGTWLAALRDPQLAPVIAEIHARPGDPWTVATLAGAAHLSRSRFAERFTATVGQAPLEYLTGWRLHLAASMLRDGHSIRDVAATVGYTSEPAFSRAFTRHHGRPPSALLPNARPRPSRGGV